MASRKGITKQTLISELNDAAEFISADDRSLVGQASVVGKVFHAFLDFLEGESVECFSHLNVDEIDLATIAAANAAYCVDPRGWLFEHWLANQHATQRRSRGVYFTPAPVTNFLLDAVAQLLKTHFDFSELAASGSANRHTTIIDPACGCGAFLSTVTKRWTTLGLGPVPRCHGIEIDETTASMARRLLPKDIVVSNLDALALCPDKAPADIVAADRLIIIGNPPYSNFTNTPHNAWMQSILADYTTGLDERKHNLHDDCIKFIRWSQFWLERCGAGVAALVVSNTFATGLTHRRMRDSLRDAFDAIYLVDLGGEENRNGSNIFAIRQGVALLVLVKTNKPKAPACHMRRTELHGSREEKLKQLASTSFASLKWQTIPPEATKFYPPAVTSPEYSEFIPLNKLFRKYISGVQTKNDGIFTALSREALECNVRSYLQGLSKDHQAECNKKVDFRSSAIRRYMMGPLDRRFIYYEPKLLGRPRVAVMKQMTNDNLGFVFMRQSVNDREYDHFLVTKDIVSDRVCYSRRGAPFLASLWLYQTGEFGRMYPSPNFSDEFLRAVWESTDSKEKPPVSPSELFAYIYAVVNAQWYRERYAATLKDDFPRVPLPRNRTRFDALSKLGTELIAAHTTQLARPVDAQTKRIKQAWRIGRGFPKYHDQHVWLNEDHSIEVDEAVWQLRMCGYAVLPRWLKQRRDFMLGKAEFAELLSLIAALKSTIEIQQRLASLFY